MDIELREVGSVVVLADHLHFGRAAIALHLSQPALTKQIHKIEGALGAPLFIRRPREVLLTRAGEVFVARARALLHEAQLAEQGFKSAIRGEAGLLRIGFGIASLAGGLPALVQEFRSRFPGIQIDMREMSSSHQLESLANRALDFGFVRLPCFVPDVSALPLFRDRLVVAVGPATQVKQRGGLEKFAREPFILVARSASASLHDHILRTCHAAGFTPRSVQEVRELFTALNLVRAGVGVALVPESSRIFKVPDVRFVETGVPSGVWTIGAAFHQSSVSDPVIINFLDIARRRFRRFARAAGGATAPR
jgi:DNA-binding transcriptional LysR family regulator